ncbi:MAG: Gfo/Idh/MocA family oxidoreductase [Anaerolineae bacterium]|nr:Gfo/Idh/MocA family oxidoreductase [Anaerolineae bacterium]
MQPETTINTGIIGLGVRGVACIARIMAEHFSETGFAITALCDRNPQRMAETETVLRQGYAAQGVHSAPRLYANGRDLIADPHVDLIIITSVTDTHRAFAVPALHSGKKVYCDKPLAQNAEDAVAIVEAEAEAQNPLIMGFTRRYEAAWLRAYALLQEGAIGDLIMLQVRDIIPYHRYLTAWWRKRAWSGGALNDKGSHLFDVFNWFTGSQAVSVHGLGGRSAIRPDPGAPPRCRLCYRDCPYRRRAPDTAAPTTYDMQAHFGPSWLDEEEEKYSDDICVYAPGADIYHNGSIHFSYANGVIASYFYSLFGPPADDQETLELVGTKGRLILTRQTGALDLATDHGATHRVFDCRDEHFEDSHFGADVALVKELRRFCEGAPPTVSARAGLEATRMVMAALRSMDAGGAVVAMKEIPDARL